MKIEMGESLAASWLKHQKKCKVVQLNWKASDTWDAKGELDSFQKISEHPLLKKLVAKKLLNEKLDKKDINFIQFLQQAEIDAVGVDFSGGKVNKVYAVEFAYHSNGLGYGNLKENLERISKKMIRSFLVLEKYFGDCDIQCLFVTPRTTGNQAEKLIERIENLNQEFNNFYVGKKKKINFSFVSDDQFNKTFIEPFLLNPVPNSDTSELYLRAINLLLLNNEDIRKFVLMKKIYTLSKSEDIGKFTQGVFRYFSSLNILNAREIAALQKLKINSFNLLSEIKSSRYYKDPYILNDKIYYLSAQLRSKNRAELLSLLIEKLKLDKNISGN